MKHSYQTLLSIALMMLFFGTARSQVLVLLEGQPAAAGVDFLWTENVAGNHFAVVGEAGELDEAGIAYRILDDDVETGAFFRIETRGDQRLNPADISGIDGSNMVWHDSKYALVRARAGSLSANLPRQYFVRRILFNSQRYQAPEIPHRQYAPPSSMTLSLIQDILDSLDVNQLYLTEEHLTGEAPFWLNGQWDSIMTRYSYSPEIYIAQNYITNRLEEMGYAVDLHSFTLGTFYDVQFSPVQTDSGWLVTDGKIFGTADGGQTWDTQHEVGGAASIWSVLPLNSRNVYAVGDGGLVLHTSDGGGNWQTQTTPTSAFLFGIAMMDENTGLICGDNGLILKTTNGGASWTIKNSPTSNRLYDVFLLSDGNAWAVGRNGAIIRSTNYGESWTSQTSGTTSRLYGVHFLDSNTGFVVGWNGRLLRTTNGGSNWAQVSIATSSYLYDVDFYDANIGIVTGWDGTCFITTDGGATWNAAGNIMGGDVYGCDILSPTTVWAAGAQTLAESTDFGATWESRLGTVSQGALNNIYATKTGTTYPDQYYIICGHYDATSQSPMVRAPGADDNGSGTAAVIEAARVLADYNFNYSIKFMVFPGEEQGLHGSAAYAAWAAQTGEQILGVLNLDMIAYDGNNDGIVEIHSGTMGSSQAIGSFLSTNIAAFGLSLIPQVITTGATTASDHASFWNYGYPAILLIEDFQDFTPYYHTTNDLLSTLNMPYFLENTRLTVGTLALLAEIDSTTVGVTPDAPLASEFRLAEPYPNPFNPSVNIEYHLPTAQRVVIDVYDLLGRRIQRLADGHQQAGAHRLQWDGTTQSGEVAASGVYVVRVKAGEYRAVKKMVLMR